MKASTLVSILILIVLTASLGCTMVHSGSRSACRDTWSIDGVYPKMRHEAFNALYPNSLDHAAAVSPVTVTLPLHDPLLLGVASEPLFHVEVDRRGVVRHVWIHLARLKPTGPDLESRFHAWKGAVACWDSLSGDSGGCRQILCSRCPYYAVIEDNAVSTVTLHAGRAPDNPL